LPVGDQGVQPVQIRLREIGVLTHDVVERRHDSEPNDGSTLP
jgi:hypothetical protein